MSGGCKCFSRWGAVARCGPNFIAEYKEPLRERGKRGNGERIEGKRKGKKGTEGTGKHHNKTINLGGYVINLFFFSLFVRLCICCLVRNNRIEFSRLNLYFQLHI